MALQYHCNEIFNMFLANFSPHYQMKNLTIFTFPLLIYLKLKNSEILNKICILHSNIIQKTDTKQYTIQYTVLIKILTFSYKRVRFEQKISIHNPEVTGSTPVLATKLKIRNSTV